MPLPTNQEKIALGGLSMPFERYNIRHPQEKRYLLDGETKPMPDALYDATFDGRPEGVRLTTADGLNDDCKYLWVISDEGLWIALEATPNPQAARKKLCHSNITEGKPAYQAGELWFLEDGRVVINAMSGRYGSREVAHIEHNLAYFRSVGYEKVEWQRF